MFFKVGCNIINISNSFSSNDLYANIIEDEKDLFQKKLDKLYDNDDLEFSKIQNTKDTFKFKISPTVKIEMPFKWSELKDLKGKNVFISGNTKYYNFDGKTSDGEIKKISGFVFYANKIQIYKKED